MRLLMRSMGFLACLFFFGTVHATHAEGEIPGCENVQISYKLNNQIYKIDAEVCTNIYNQYYSKNCSDGCEFREAIINNKSFNIPSYNGVGTPGWNVCSQLGYRAYIVEFDFHGKNVKNLGLCFNKSKDGFVSTGFLSDLANERKKNKEQ